MSAPSWVVDRPIAHRGLHDPGRRVIENTLSAARAAVEAGYAIECDVQWTADGEAVVFHDFTLDRLTSAAGPVSAHTASALGSMAITGSDGDKIPSLQQLLDEIARRVPLIVEIKSRFDGDMRLTGRVCEILASYDGPVAVKSFDPDIVAEVRRQAPDLVRGIVAESHYSHPSYAQLTPERKHALANLLHFEESRPQFISWQVKHLPAAAPFLSRLLGGCPVMTWTVRTPEDRERAALHADQIVFEGFRP